MNNAQPVPAEGAKAIFDQVRFQVVVSDGWSVVDAEKISNTLRDNGAEEIKKTSDSLSLSELTHIISPTSDFPDYYPAKDRLISVAKPDWVTASIVKGRLANPRQYSPDPKLFFSGLVVCCADLPPGDADAIIGGVLAMGGLHTGAVSKLVTHIVALTLDPDKCKVSMSKNLKCKIVLPHWFDDCLKLGKRIDEGPYCLPNPEILRKRSEETIQAHHRPDMQGSSSTLPTSLDPPGTPDRQLTVFKNKIVMLSADLGIGSHLRATIEGLIKSGGGSITGSVYNSNIFICQYRDTRDYRIASRARQDVGNLAWLYHLFTHNKWTYPMRRLLHYPIAKDGLPGFSKFRISLSNYNGEARVYLENLAKAAGGDFTRTMKEDNTHLITAHLNSEKCTAAREWNVKIINHLWLEESYAKWQIQSEANPRYTHFPHRTNLGEVVGQTEIDREAIEKQFFPAEPKEASSTVEAGMRAMKVKDNNANPKPPVPNSTAAGPTSSARVAEPVSIHSDQPTPKAQNKSFGSAAVRTPAQSRFVNNEKENETPSTTGSRGAKQKAAAKISGMAPDIELYQKQTKRVGGVVHSRRKHTDEVISDGNRKRSLSKDDEDDTDVDVPDRAAKKAKRSKDASVMQLLITGDTRWVDNPTKESNERAQLKSLGINVVDKDTRCTHVAVPRIIRTPKFASALAHGPVILTLDYIEQCLAQNTKMNPDDFLLKESKEDKDRGYNLEESRTRAKNNKSRLLRGYTVYCTNEVRGGFDAYKSIVTANGGDCMLYKARASSSAFVAPAGGDREDSDPDPSASNYLYLISGTTPEEAKLWPKFRQMAQSKGRTGRIVSNNWLLDQAIRQEVCWLEDYELKPNNVDRPK